ncbi:MAG: long-chain fatty acid--CoA ligase [Candidatus Eisenbacteria bacterium]
MPKTLIRIFLDSVEQYRKPAHFMRRLPDTAGRGRWESLSSERARTDVEGLALGLTALGVRRGDRVALLSENRYEWPITDLATLGVGAVTVPIYPTLTAPQVRYILDNAEARVCVLSSAAQLEKLLAVADSLPRLASIVVMDPPPAARDSRVTSWALVRADGERRRKAEPQAFRAMADATKSSDLATIIYTSGTTGDPKGAMLTHDNIASNVEAALQVVDLNPNDTCLSFLPLCHIFERMAGLYAMLAGGCTIAYARSVDTVAADAQEVHPTVLTGVPRFYEKVYARVMENAGTQPPLRRAIFHWGLGVGRQVAQLRFQGKTAGFALGLVATVADKLVGHKVRERVGGRIRFCISGGAPLGPKIMEFFFAIGIPVIEGYGLTETSPVICLNRPGQERPGAVGPPIPGVEVSFGAESEILARGPGVMQGYFRNEEATRACIRDGWFHTGDVGHLDAEGNLRITDRLKDLLVTAGGKKVAPQPLEGKLKASRWLSEAVMLGDQRPFCVALLVPNFANLEAEAKVHGWPAGSRRELLAAAPVRALYQGVIDELNAGLAPFETIKRFELLDRDLSAEAGELTPTLKVRRKVVTQTFAALIEGMYAGGAPPA